ERRQDVALERAHPFALAGAGRLRTVEGRAGAFADAALARRAGAGVEGELVEARVEDGRVGFEGVLRPVAVVDVEVEDGNTCEIPSAAQMARGDRDLIEQAEAHRAVGLRVVARRACGDESVPPLAAQHAVDGRERAP